MWSIVDILASQYGWAKDAILESIYLDEFLQLQKQIKNRKILDIKLQLNIAQNPHTKDPKKFFEELDRLEDKPIEKPVLDKTGFSILKSKLAKSSSIVVK